MYKDEIIAEVLTSTLPHIKTLILFAINLKLHTTAFAFLDFDTDPIFSRFGLRLNR